MKVSNGQLSFLISLCGIAALAMMIIYVAKPNYDDAKSIEAENVTLQAKLADLQAKEAHRAEYEAGIVTYNEKFDAVLSAFAPDLNQEVSIMFLQGIRDDYEYDIPSVGLGEKQHFYTLGQGAGQEAILGSTDSSATASTDGSLTDATAPVETAAYECYKADFPIAYTGAYEDIKDVVNYVDNYSQRMVINSVDIAYDEANDQYTGSMNLVCYSIESPERPETQLELNEVEIGVDNIFMGGSGSSDASSAKLTKYDENDGLEIVKNYDFYAMLNPAGSDVSPKMLGQNGADKDKTIITNDENTVSTMNFDFYEQDGKNYCKYTLDNGTSYEAEITSAEDVKLLIRSSARKDADDKVGARVTIRNTTTLPVYVKIQDEDAVSPRINVTSKSGSVKIY